MKSISFRKKLKEIDASLNKTLNSYRNNDEFLSKTISFLQGEISHILINLSTNKKVFQRLSSKCVQLMFLFYKTFSQDDLKNDLKQKFTEQLSAALEILKNIYFNNNSHNHNFVQFVYIQYLNDLINKANINSIKDYLENVVKENINEKLIVEIICILLSNNKLDIFKLIPELKNKLFSVLSECQDVKLKIKLLLHIERCLRQTNGQTLYIYLRSFPKLFTICVKLLNTNIINDSYAEILIQHIFVRNLIITKNDLNILFKDFFQNTSYKNINALDFHGNTLLEEMNNSHNDQESFSEFKKTSSILIKSLLKKKEFIEIISNLELPIFQNPLECLKENNQLYFSIFIYYFYYLEKYKDKIEYKLPEDKVKEFRQAILKSFIIAHKDEDKATLKLKFEIIDAAREDNTNLLTIFSETGEKNIFMLIFPRIMNKYYNWKFLNNFFVKSENAEFSKNICELFVDFYKFDDYYSELKTPKQPKNKVKPILLNIESQIKDLKSLVNLFIKQLNKNQKSIANNLNIITEKLLTVNNCLFELITTNDLIFEMPSFLQNSISFIIFIFDYLKSKDKATLLSNDKYFGNVNKLFTYIIQVKENQNKINIFVSLAKQIFLFIDKIMNFFPKFISLNNCNNILQFIHKRLYSKIKIDCLELNSILSILTISSVLIIHNNAEHECCLFMDVLAKLFSIIINSENVLLDNKLNSKLKLLFNGICYAYTKFSSEQSTFQFKLIEFLKFINTINFEPTNLKFMAVLRGLLQIYSAFIKNDFVKKILKTNFCNSSFLVDYCTNLVNLLDYYFTQIYNVETLFKINYILINEIVILLIRLITNVFYIYSSFQNYQDLCFKENYFFKFIDKLFSIFGFIVKKNNSIKNTKLFSEIVPFLTQVLDILKSELSSNNHIYITLIIWKHKSFREIISNILYQFSVIFPENILHTSFGDFCKTLYSFLSALSKHSICVTFINILTLHSINTKFLKNKIFDLNNPKLLGDNISKNTNIIENFKLNNKHKPDIILNANINFLNLIFIPGFSHDIQQKQVENYKEHVFQTIKHNLSKIISENNLKKINISKQVEKIEEISANKYLTSSLKEFKYEYLNKKLLENMLRLNFSYIQEHFNPLITKFIFLLNQDETIIFKQTKFCIVYTFLIIIQKTNFNTLIFEHKDLRDYIVNSFLNKKYLINNTYSIYILEIITLYLLILSKNSDFMGTEKKKKVTKHLFKNILGNQQIHSPNLICTCLSLIECYTSYQKSLCFTNFKDFFDVLYNKILAHFPLDILILKNIINITSSFITYNDKDIENNNIQKYFKEFLEKLFTFINKNIFDNLCNSGTQKNGNLNITGNKTFSSSTSKLNCNKEQQKLLFISVINLIELITQNNFLLSMMFKDILTHLNIIYKIIVELQENESMLTKFVEIMKKLVKKDDYKNNKSYAEIMELFLRLISQNKFKEEYIFMILKLLDPLLKSILSNHIGCHTIYLEYLTNLVEVNANNKELLCLVYELINRIYFNTFGLGNSNIIQDNMPRFNDYFFNDDRLSTLFLENFNYPEIIKQIKEMIVIICSIKNTKIILEDFIMKFISDEYMQTLSENVREESFSIYLSMLNSFIKNDKWNFTDKFSEIVENVFNFIQKIKINVNNGSIFKEFVKLLKIFVSKSNKKDIESNKIKELLFWFLDTIHNNTMNYLQITELNSLLHACVKEGLITTFNDYYFYNLIKNLFSKTVIENIDIVNLITYYSNVNLLDIAKICIHDSNNQRNYDAKTILEIFDNALNTLIELYQKNNYQKKLPGILDHLKDLIHCVCICNPKFVNYLAKVTDKEIILEEGQDQQINTRFSICPKEKTNNGNNLLENFHKEIRSFIQNTSKDLILEYSVKVRYIANLKQKVQVKFHLPNKSKSVHKGSFYLKLENNGYHFYFKIKNFLLKNKKLQCPFIKFNDVQYSNENRNNILTIKLAAPIIINKEEYLSFDIEVKEHQKSAIPCQTIIESLFGLVKAMSPFPRDLID